MKVVSGTSNIPFLQLDNSYVDILFCDHLVIYNLPFFLYVLCFN